MSTEYYNQGPDLPALTSAVTAAVAASAVTDAALLAAAQLLDVKKTEALVVAAVAGAEAGNAIEVACTIKDRSGNVIASAREVMVESFAVTNAKGVISAAGTPVGTLQKVNSPATGANRAWFTTTAGGLFSFSIADDQVESVICVIHADGCDPKLVKLTFA